MRQGRNQAAEPAARAFLIFWPQDRTSITRRRARPARLRTAADGALLSAWDNTVADQSALPHAIEALSCSDRPRQHVASSGPPGAAAKPPRSDTKHAALLTLLRRPEGASGPQMADAAGWAPHTVRGFLAGLAKRGIRVMVLERVRQVGPGKEGAKGSYTVYRVAEAG